MPTLRPATFLPPTRLRITADTKQMSMVGYDKLGNTVQYDFYFTKTAVTTPRPPLRVLRAHGRSQSSPRRCGNRWNVVISVHSGSDGSRWLDEFDLRCQRQDDQHRRNDDQRPGHYGFHRHEPQRLHAARRGFCPAAGTPNGQAASPVKDVTIDKDGTVYAKYSDGTSKPIYRIPLATVASPDNY